MNLAQAVKIAVACMERERRLLAPDASYHDIYGADFPAAVNASKRRKRIDQAIELLREMEETNNANHQS